MPIRIPLAIPAGSSSRILQEFSNKLLRNSSTDSMIPLRIPFGIPPGIHAGIPSGCSTRISLSFVTRVSQVFAHSISVLGNPPEISGSLSAKLEEFQQDFLNGSHYEFMDKF